MSTAVVEMREVSERLDEIEERLLAILDEDAHTLRRLRAIARSNTRIREDLSDIAARLSRTRLRRRRRLKVGPLALFL